MVDPHVALRQAIAQALRAPGDGDFAARARNLLAALGYRGDRTLPGQTGAVDDFLEQFPAANPGTKSEAEFRDAAASVHVLFQLTDEEIRGADGNPTLFSDDEFQTGNVKSFLFASVELRGDGYAKGRYAALTREINKRLQMPAVVLFRAGSGALTLAFVHRRENLRDPSRDVLGRVSLIREIAPVKPHRAHVDILAELSLNERLQWMSTHGKDRNFDGLLAAWLDALDTEELNRRFYKDLFAWFERAVDTARFPTDQVRTLSAEEHVIRLITRLLFVWFIKEKRLIAEELFVENQVARLLRDYDCVGDSYYRAVLQNLFFATLNTEISRRSFSRQANSTHRDFSRYRYEMEIADPPALLELFAKTPFINGGLFDCLDSEEATSQDGYRIDYFSDNVIRKGANEYAKLSIPNWLFFGNEGLIDLFNHYKFTVEENTPAEQEVALDPELLGKVFENLLAAYNPETRETARKQTGSYYTPRPVVDYMVEEALVASLVGKMETASAESAWWEDRLRYLLDYNDAFEDAAELFSEDESDEVIRAIAGLKVLDPAVGSGAFPMGALNKLTLALRRLDPDNTRWEELQKELAGDRAKAAFDTSDQGERDAELAEISATFQRYRDSDFGRKLYLMQNSIYGVDIQAVATQIAKLRFFISLAIEQQPDPAAGNYGIKPLPNLETRFVAANTLLGLERPPQLSFAQTGAVADCQQQLNDNRERHFHASTRPQKLACRREDKRLRQELASALREADFPAADAAKISRWDPYDLNHSADWFDPAYMFGVETGFDVVIGNPPYVESRNSLMSAEAKDAYLRQVRSDWDADLPRGSDLLIYFLARSAKLLGEVGWACLITQNAWLSTDYGKAFQDFVQGRFYFHRIVDTSARFFSDVHGPNINAVICLFGRAANDSIAYAIADPGMSVMPMRTIRSQQDIKWGHVFAMPDFLEMILRKLAENEDMDLKKATRFGQGINVRNETIDVPGADVPTLLEAAQFVASHADSAVLSSTIGKRASKVPALIMPRGIGRYYCAFNACKALSFSGVELYLRQELWGSDTHLCLWAFLNSSLAWLFREVTGRRNLGEVC